MGEMGGDDQNREQVDMSAPRSHTPKSCNEEIEISRRINTVQTRISGLQ